jgi:DNA-binding transcriptional LysR family regulator
VHLRDLTYFLAAAEEGSFSRAARRCFIAQQGLSAAIRRLERDVGQTLFERERTGARLTTAGTLLVPRARALLELAEHTVSSLRDQGDEHAVLRAGLVSPAAGDWTSTILRAFRVTHPGVEVGVRQLAFDELGPALDAGRIDVALTVGPAADPRWRVTPLFTEPLVAILPRRHRLTERAAVRADELLEETFLAGAALRSEWIGFWRLEELRNGEAARLGDPVASDARTPVEVNEVVAAGAGIITGPRSHARAFAHRGIACVPITDAPPAQVAAVRLAWPHNTIADTFADVAAATAARLAGLPRQP